MNPLWRQRPDLALRDFDDLVEWLDEVGFVLFLPKRGVLLPSAREAILGRPYGGGPAWMGGWGDGSMERLWSWKDRLGAERRGYYGAGLLPHLSLVSLRLLPALLALTPSHGSSLGLYEEGLLSRDAHQIYDALLERGELSRNALRRDFGPSANRLGRALEELEKCGFIVRVGVEDEGHGWPATIYGTFGDAHPEIVTESARMQPAVARRQILAAYFMLAPQASDQQAARALGWPRALVQATRVQLA